MTYPPPPQPEQPQTEPPKKKSTGRKILSIVAGGLVVIVAVVIIGTIMQDDAVTAEVGNCVKVAEGGETDANIDVVDCGSQEALFEVAKKLDDAEASCPTEDYDKYTQTGDSGGFTLCLVMSAQEGECLTGVESQDVASMAKVPCTDGTAEVKITKMSETADDGLCGEDGAPLVYPEPKRTFCFGPTA